MIKIFADTLSCISPTEAQQLGLAYLPQIIVFGENEQYRDDSEMDSRQFLKRLRTSTTLPKTAAPSPELYKPYYQQVADAGDTAIVVCPAATLSGTVRSATVAAQEFPDADIHIVDTNLIAGGLGAVVKQALRWAEAGLPADTIIEKVQEMSARERVYFVVDTLEYLYKGGRIGAAKALFGSLLQVKPILTLRNGTTQPYDSQRTHRRAVARLKEIVMTDCPRSPEAHLCVMHGDCEEEARQFAAELGGELNIPAETIPVYDMTPAILVHAGPGLIAVSFFVSQEPA